MDSDHPAYVLGFACVFVQLTFTHVAQELLGNVTSV